MELHTLLGICHVFTYTSAKLLSRVRLTPISHCHTLRESGLTNISLLLCAFTVCYSTVDTSSEGIAMAESNKLSLQHVTTALYPLSIEQMKELVVYFGVELRVISDIETTHKENIKMYSIQAWLDQDTEASWEKIVSGLEQIGMNVLARQAATQHCPQSLVSATPSSDPHQPATVPTSQPTNTPAPPGTSSVATSQQPASGHTPQPEATLYPPQPTNTPASPTPATPSPVAATPPVTDCDQSPNQPPHTTPATVSDQSNPDHYSQALALPPHSTYAPTNAHPSIVSPPSIQSRLVVRSVHAVHARVTIRKLEWTFSSLVYQTRSAMCRMEREDAEFLDEFRDRLFNLRVAKKVIHVKFFRENEDDIIEAGSIRKVFVILSRYWSYRNYEVLQEIVICFCAAPLQESMEEYCKTLVEFEKTTTVDVYISAMPLQTEIEVAFSQMVVKINKPASECTLYEIRQLNEALMEGSSLYSHSVYIGSVAENCVVVSVSFPSSAVGWVLSAMTTNFMTTHCLSEVTLDGQQLTLELGETWKLVCDTKSCVMCSCVHICTCTVQCGAF